MVFFMEAVESLFHFNTRKGKIIFLRYPKISDLQIMKDYINTLSQERTYIRMQGEIITDEDEEKYLTEALETIDDKTSVHLLAFHEDQLVGIAAIALKDRIESHVGVLGLSVAKDFRGEGIGTKLLECVIEQSVINMPKLAIVSLEVYSENETAIQIYKNLGFVNYGRLPKSVNFRGRYIDQCYMYRNVRNLA